MEIEKEAAIGIAAIFGCVILIGIGIWIVLGIQASNRETKCRRACYPSELLVNTDTLCLCGDDSGSHTARVR